MTASPVPEINGSTMKWILVVAHIEALHSYLALGKIKSSFPTFPSFNWLVLQPVLSKNRMNSGLVSLYLLGKPASRWIYSLTSSTMPAFTIILYTLLYMFLKFSLVTQVFLFKSLIAVPLLVRREAWQLRKTWYHLRIQSQFFWLEACLSSLV